MFFRSGDNITTAHSITHNVAFRQANLSSNPQSQVNSIVSNTFETKTNPTQQQALELYALGFNVFPQPHGKKAGLPWRQLQYTRLHATHPTLGIEALFEGKCNIAVMCGRTSNNLFVIDCETQTALDYHTRQLRQRNIPLWIVETARGGHIYLLCADGEVKSVESGIIADAEIRGSRGYVLAATSIHPTGAIYGWLTREGKTPPTVSADDINWLTAKNGSTIKLQLTSRKGAKFTPFNPLSRATQDYLANGDLLAQGSRNNRLFSAACDMVGSSIDSDEIERQLMPIAERSGLPMHEAAATLRSAFSRTRKPARPQKQYAAKEQPELWKYALAFAEAQQWGGRTGTSDKLVLLALIERAKAATNENGIFRASSRELSVISRTSINTTQKALKRLQDVRIIFYSGQDATSQASLWKFSDITIKEGQSKAESFPATPPWISCSDSVFNSTDVCERGALGYNGLCVYKAMLSAARPMMPAAMAAMMGIPVHRVNYALKKLLSYGMVVREAGGWCAVAVEDGDLDERVSRPSGKLGTGAARRERYAAQRALYVGRLISRARSESFRSDFFYQQRDLEQMVKLDSCSNNTSSLIVEAEVVTLEESVKLWKCPNCGQVHFAEVPPDMCDFCRDFTTWKSLDEADSEALSDPVVLLALELGAEVYMIEDGKRRLIAGQKRDNPPPK